MMLPQGDPIGEHDIDDPDCYCELCKPGPESKMIEKFAADGKPIYYFSDPVTGHSLWDEDCSCEACRDLSFYEEMAGINHQSYNPHKRKQRKSKKKSIHSQLYRKWIQGDPSVGPLVKTMEDLSSLLIMVQNPQNQNQLKFLHHQPKILLNNRLCHHQHCRASYQNIWSNLVIKNPKVGQKKSTA
ncbi:hypothetical protein GQ457_09G013560 [Hibiscus cannabinus]